MAIVGCDSGSDNEEGSGERVPVVTTGLDASRSHPVTKAGDTIALAEVPQFIVLGFDDNGIADYKEGGGASWILNYLKTQTNSDGSPMEASFYMTGKYAAQWVYEDKADVKKVWLELHAAGHEIGVHSMNHLMWYNNDTDNGNYDGRAYSREEWKTKELDPVMTTLTTGTSMFDLGVGIPLADLVSWRTPRLEWNNALFGLLNEEGFLYDCSIESDSTEDAQSEYWPFSMDNGCPWESSVSSHVGLWEMPAYRFHIPAGIAAKAGQDIVTGLDYNVWIKKAWGGLELSGPDFTEILKYTLDERMKGNKAPMLVGLHSDIYTSQKDADNLGTANARERQLAIENFLQYAKDTYPSVRIVKGTDVIDWLKDPQPLK